MSGTVICTSGCATTGTGKAFKFDFVPIQTSLDVLVSSDISITAGGNSIQIHGWTQEPNTGLTGRVWIKELSDLGGSVQISTPYKWISVFAKNPGNSNLYDGVCFKINGNSIQLIAFS